jgi:hypothetical protein
MTPPILCVTASASAAELISLPHIEIIDPPNKLRQEIKTKNNPGTRHGDEFGATLTSQTLAPDASKRIGCQAVSIRAQDLTEGWSVPFPPLLSSASLASLHSLSLSFSPIPFSGLLWQITKIQLPLSQIFVENHPELVVLLQEAEDLTSLLRLLTQRLIRNALALGTEIFLEPQGISSGDQKLNMSFDFGSLESGDGTGISKQPHGVVNWKK